MWRPLSALALFTLLAGCASHDIDPRGYDETGTASYYGSRHHGKRTASGEPFDQHGLTAAHRSLPFGTRVRVTNLKNERSVVVRINDRGPHTRGRLIDLSKAAAQKLDMIRSGTARVRVQSLSD
ncbi:septal ring lytic transglycosylase RlpA family protein [Pseudomonas huaxiensis]|uniref:septal ring lytic transglycosylase RlpA family protein n=1 Tax=Pseudomonas huaxiensis TaxID=2213017 RepID=UPI000DA66F2D|nr:septal ring lytic transglycosylase RlpA family protein [Pseudomonas huaxiensis]